MNNPISSKEIQVVVKNYQILGPLISLTNTTEQLRKKNTNSISPLTENRKGGSTPNSYFDTRTILILKSDKEITRKENYRPVSLMNINVKTFKKIESYNVYKQLCTEIK